MEARVTKVARVSARFSKSLARRRFRPNHDVRSHPSGAAGRRRPSCRRAPLDDFHTSSGTFATAASTCQALWPPSAQISSVAAPSWPHLLVASGALWLSGRLLPRRRARAASARGPGGAVGRGALCGARPADAGAVRMTRLLALGAVILALAGCVEGGQRFYLSRYTELRPGISTVEDAKALLGPPYAESHLPNMRSMVWTSRYVVDDPHALGLLFGPDGKMIAVASVVH
jgi:hypothetical protein